MSHCVPLYKLIWGDRRVALPRHPSHSSSSSSVFVSVLRVSFSSWTWTTTTIYTTFDGLRRVLNVYLDCPKRSPGLYLPFPFFTRLVLFRRPDSLTLLLCRWLILSLTPSSTKYPLRVLKPRPVRQNSMGSLWVRLLTSSYVSGRRVSSPNPSVTLRPSSVVHPSNMSVPCPMIGVLCRTSVFFFPGTRLTTPCETSSVPPFLTPFLTRQSFYFQSTHTLGSSVPFFPPDNFLSLLDKLPIHRWTKHWLQNDLVSGR